MQEEEKINPYINVGIVLRMKIQDFGKLEQFISSLYGAEIFYVEKVPKNVKLKIEKEEFGGIENGRKFRY